MAKDFMLITVCDREISAELFETFKDAQNTMHKEMIEQGQVPEDIFDMESYDDYDYGFGKDFGYANDGVNHADYDWRIIDLEEEW